MNDIVYILKNGIDSEELRYSLRSVEKNFPFNRVCFFGGKPADIEPDLYVEIIQEGTTKWEKSTGTLRKACECDELTDDIWLFNDDFFIMAPIECIPYMYGGTMADRIAEQPSGYTKQLDDTRKLLENNGFGTLNYALHVPMLINRRKALEVLNTFPQCPMFRCLYGNFARVGGENVEDVKIRDKNVAPKDGQTFISTSDTTFNIGIVGKIIQERFPEPCRWERLEK